MAADTTRRRILNVAHALFRAHGFEGATMRKIASEAGLSLGVAYHHYASKQAIIAAFYEQHVEAHEAAARPGLAEAKTLRDRLSLVMHIALDVRGLDRNLL